MDVPVASCSGGRSSEEFADHMAIPGDRLCSNNSRDRFVMAPNDVIIELEPERKEYKWRLEDLYEGIWNGSDEEEEEGSEDDEEIIEDDDDDSDEGQDSDSDERQDNDEGQDSEAVGGGGEGEAEDSEDEEEQDRRRELWLRSAEIDPYWKDDPIMAAFKRPYRTFLSYYNKFDYDGRLPKTSKGYVKIPRPKPDPTRTELTCPICYMVDFNGYRMLEHVKKCGYTPPGKKIKLENIKQEPDDEEVPAFYFMGIKIKTEKPDFPVLNIKQEKPDLPVVKIEMEKPDFPGVKIKTEKPDFPAVKIKTEKPDFPAVKIKTEKLDFPAVKIKTEKPDSQEVRINSENPELQIIDIRTIDRGAWREKVRRGIEGESSSSDSSEEAMPLGALSDDDDVRIISEDEEIRTISDDEEVTTAEQEERRAPSVAWKLVQVTREKILDRIKRKMRPKEGRSKKRKPDKKTRFTCNLCGFKTPLSKFTKYNKCLLAVHMRRHSGAKRMRCDACPYVTRKDSVFIKHSLAHYSERPFTCEYCGVVRRLPEDLRRHMALHIGYRGFRCSKCAYKSSNAASLRRHVASAHHGARTFACSACSFTTRHKASMVSHLTAHNALAAFRCRYCPFTAAAEATLDDHTEKRHSAAQGLRYYVEKEVKKRLMELALDRIRSVKLIARKISGRSPEFPGEEGVIAYMRRRRDARRPPLDTPVAPDREEESIGPDSDAGVPPIKRHVKIYALDSDFEESTDPEEFSDTDCDYCDDGEVPTSEVLSDSLYKKFLRKTLPSTAPLLEKIGDYSFYSLNSSFEESSESDISSGGSDEESTPSEAADTSFKRPAPSPAFPRPLSSSYGESTDKGDSGDDEASSDEEEGGDASHTTYERFRVAVNDTSKEYVQPLGERVDTESSDEDYFLENVQLGIDEYSSDDEYVPNIDNFSNLKILELLSNSDTSYPEMMSEGSGDTMSGSSEASSDAWSDNTDEGIGSSKTCGSSCDGDEEGPNHSGDCDRSQSSASTASDEAIDGCDRDLCGSDCDCDRSDTTDSNDSGSECGCDRSAEESSESGRLTVDGEDGPDVVEPMPDLQAEGAKPPDLASDGAMPRLRPQQPEPAPQLRPRAMPDLRPRAPQSMPDLRPQEPKASGSMPQLQVQKPKKTKPKSPEEPESESMPALRPKSVESMPLLRPSVPSRPDLQGPSNSDDLQPPDLRDSPDAMPCLEPQGTNSKLPPTKKAKVSK